MSERLVGVGHLVDVFALLDRVASALGGFRHSDTVAVTEDGLEFLTYYPRDLESLTLPA